MTSNEPRQRRQYLTGEQRKKELLDAALLEFSSAGYVAATIERIALRAGLSKAGVYAHYKSKDEIFVELLNCLLTASFLPVKDWLFNDSVPFMSATRAFFDQLYAPLEDPKVLAMIRLLLLESGRVPHLVQRWREEVLEPFMEEQQAVINQHADKGCMRAGALTRHFFQLIVLAPLAMAAHWLLIFCADDAEASAAYLQGVKAKHYEVLEELVRHIDA